MNPVQFFLSIGQYLADYVRKTAKPGKFVDICVEQAKNLNSLSAQQVGAAFGVNNTVGDLAQSFEFRDLIQELITTEGSEEDEEADPALPVFILFNVATAKTEELTNTGKLGGQGLANSRKLRVLREALKCVKIDPTMIRFDPAYFGDLAEFLDQQVPSVRSTRWYTRLCEIGGYQCSKALESRLGVISVTKASTRERVMPSSQKHMADIRETLAQRAVSTPAAAPTMQGQAATNAVLPPSHVASKAPSILDTFSASAGVASPASTTSTVSIQSTEQVDDSFDEDSVVLRLKKSGAITPEVAGSWLAGQKPTMQVGTELLGTNFISADEFKKIWPSV